MPQWSRGVIPAPAAGLVIRRVCLGYAILEDLPEKGSRVVSSSRAREADDRDRARNAPQPGRGHPGNGECTTSPSAADRRISQVRISVRFKDDQAVEFSEELATCTSRRPGSPEARRLAEVREAGQLRHPDRIPKIQLPLSVGERVPVRYDAADRSKLVIDLPGAAETRAARLHPARAAAEGPTARSSGRQERAALDCAGALPELRRAGRSGEGIPGPRPPVPVLPPAGPGEPEQYLVTHE